jgi:hypothetical protein
MNPTELQTILSTVLREQEQRFTQLIETLRLGNGVATQATLAQTTCSGQRKLQPPQLPHIEAYVADIENPTHLEDWLKRFEMSLFCAATKKRQWFWPQNFQLMPSPSFESAVSQKKSQTIRTKRQ